MSLTLWRDWLTDEVLTGFHLNERQLQTQTIAYLKSTGVIIKMENGSIYTHVLNKGRRGLRSPCGCLVTRADSDSGDGMGGKSRSV